MPAMPADSYIKKMLSQTKVDLPSHDDLFEILVRVTEIYENSTATYRPRTSSGCIGGLLDFRQCASDDLPAAEASAKETLAEAGEDGNRPLPLIIVPDLHARFYFFKNILNYTLPFGFLFDGTENSDSSETSSITVLEALQKKLIRLICVGDGLHSESRGKERWLSAWKDFCNGKNAGKAMKEEMAEGLSLMKLVMECKCAFPDVFHFLKGNHENIESLEAGGDFPFHKFVQESLMTRRFMVEYYGDDILYLYSCFEKALPLIALFDNCIVSHAEPARAFSYKELLEGRNNPDVVKGLIWTNNGEALNDSAEKMLNLFSCSASGIKPLYFAGHRPISGSNFISEKKCFVQIHNPDRQFITLLYPGKIFNPETDIVDVSEEI